jgi:hypothetical protein
VHKGLIASLMIVASPAAWAACDQPMGQRVASQVTSDFAMLVGFTKAACVAAADGHQCSLVCVSDLNVIGDNRNLALIMITASAGKRMRDAGIGKFARVSFADRDLLSSRKALYLSAQEASQLQTTLSSDAEAPLAKAARVGSKYKVMEIPKR